MRSGMRAVREPQATRLARGAHSRRDPGDWCVLPVPHVQIVKIRRATRKKTAHSQHRSTTRPTLAVAAAQFYLFGLAARALMGTLLTAVLPPRHAPTTSRRSRPAQERPVQTPGAQPPWVGPAPGRYHRRTRFTAWVLGHSPPQHAR